MECTVVTAERNVRNVIVGCQGSDVNASGDVKFPIRLNCDKVVSKAREKSQIHNI